MAASVDAMSGTGAFIFVSNKELICVRKLFMNDISQKIEKRKKCVILLKALYTLLLSMNPL